MEDRIREVRESDQSGEFGDDPGEDENDPLDEP